MADPADSYDLLGRLLPGRGDRLREDDVKTLKVGRAAFQRWISRLGQLLVDGGIPADRAEGAAIMVIAGTEGAVVMARALRSLGPLDTVGHQLRSLAEELMSRPAKRTRRPR